MANPLESLRKAVKPKSPEMLENHTEDESGESVEEMCAEMKTLCDNICKKMKSM